MLRTHISLQKKVTRFCLAHHLWTSLYSGSQVMTPASIGNTWKQGSWLLWPTVHACVIKTDWNTLLGDFWLRLQHSTYRFWSRRAYDLDLLDNYHDLKEKHKSYLEITAGKDAVNLKPFFIFFHSQPLVIHSGLIFQYSLHEETTDHRIY